MSDSVSISFSGDRLKRFSSGLLTWKQEMRTQIRKATLYTQSVVIKDFLSVSDGGAKTLRSFGPGLRAPTGQLRNSLNTDFRDMGTNFEGAVGTNIAYGRIHEERHRMGKTNKRGLTFGFLQPGLQKAMPTIRKMFQSAIQGKLDGFNG